MRYLAVSVLIHSFFFLLLGRIIEFPTSLLSQTEAIHLTFISGLSKKSSRGPNGPRDLFDEIPRYARNDHYAQDDRFDWPLHMPSPSYPLLAKEKGWEGEVVFRLKTDQNGYIESLQMLSGSGYQLLDEEAYRAVKEWRLAPRLIAQIPIVFRLK